MDESLAHWVSSPTPGLLGLGGCEEDLLYIWMKVLLTEWAVLLQADLSLGEGEKKKTCSVVVWLAESSVLLQADLVFLVKDRKAFSKDKAKI